MSERIANHSGDAARGVKDPSLGWIIAFLFVVSFLGLFSVVPLRKVCVKPKRDIKAAGGILHCCIVFLLDNDNRLQTNIPKWHCNCSPYQQLSHSSRSKAGQV